MNREDKYPSTSTFKYFNANPKGKITGDCVIRALSVAMEKDYFEVMDELHQYSKKYCQSYDDNKLYHKYLQDNGWVKMPQPRKANGTKYTGKEFCRLHMSNANVIAHIGGHHIVAIVDNQVVDSWDSTDGCIGNYYIKK